MTKFTIKYRIYRITITMYNDRIKILKGENVEFGRENLLIIIGALMVLEADPPATAGGSASKTPHFWSL